MAAKVQIYKHQAFLDHQPGVGHPDCSARLEAIYEALEALDCIEYPEIVAATPEQVAAVHGQAYVDFIDGSRGQSRFIDGDTVLSERSAEAAFLAVGAGMQAVDQLLTGQAERAFVLARPPGHHAEPNRGMGFCLFNSIAVAAAHARRQACERVMIVDWDVHHGNGSQSAFYDDPNVLVFNTHQFPYYPGTGALTEDGEGAGQGFNVNVPLMPGMAYGDYLAIYKELLVPVAEEYKPDLILVSAGFDAHEDDPLGGMELCHEAFAELCQIVCQLSEKLCHGRLALFLEGGYNLKALAQSVQSCVRVMAGERAPEEALIASPRGEYSLRKAQKHFADYWCL